MFFKNKIDEQEIPSGCITKNGYPISGDVVATSAPLNTETSVYTRKYIIQLKNDNPQKPYTKLGEMHLSAPNNHRGKYYIRILSLITAGPIGRKNDPQRDYEFITGDTYTGIEEILCQFAIEESRQHGCDGNIRISLLPEEVTLYKMLGFEEELSNQNCIAGLNNLILTKNRRPHSLFRRQRLETEDPIPCAIL